MRIGLLSARIGGWHARDLARAAKVVGLEVVPMDSRNLRGRVETFEAKLGAPESPEIFCGAVAAEELDAVLVRSIPAGSLEQVVFRMDALQRLRARGVCIINPPSAIETCVDKYLALARLAADELPVPRTRVTESAAQAREDFFDLGRDTVVKPLFGSGGRGMLRLSDPDLADRAFRTLERLGHVIYQQEFVPLRRGDLRVLVVGREPAAAMGREIPAGCADFRADSRAGARAGAPEWRTNVARGGRASPHSMTDEEADLAVRAAIAVGADLAGVDLLPAADGRLLISEVNSAPGWRALSKVTGTDVAALVLEHMRRVAQER